MPTQVQHSATAITYARSLLELAQAQGVIEATRDELTSLREILSNNPGISAFFSDPSISRDNRAAVIDKVLKPQLSPLLSNFLGVVNLHGRTNILTPIAQAFDDLVDQLQGRIDVEVTVASELDAEQLEQVRQSVSTALNKNAVITQTVNQDIIGGMVLRVGDKLIDASVKHQLAAMKQQFLNAKPK